MSDTADMSESRCQHNPRAPRRHKRRLKSYFLRRHILKKKLFQEHETFSVM
jgi:hypothetical protein